MSIRLEKLALKKQLVKCV